MDEEGIRKEKDPESAEKPVLLNYLCYSATSVPILMHVPAKLTPGQAGICYNPHSVIVRCNPCDAVHMSSA